MPQKEKKMACQRSMTQKKEKKREKEVAMSQKKERDRDDSREKTNALRSKPHLSIHPSTHPLIHLQLLIDIAWLVSPWILSLTLQYMECKYALFLSYLELHKSFLAVGKTEGRYYPIKVECLERIILRTLPYFQKNLKYISRWIADRWTSMYYSMHRSNSQQPKTRWQLRSPMK